MAEDLMRYDLLAQEALRGVVRAALARAAKEGLPGEHHFYIAISTRHDGVGMSERLRRKYPEEVTIVLQHQFSNLQVDERQFSVDLSFDNIPERLVVPFAAIKGFVDPAAQFGLQFEVKLDQAPAERPEKRKPTGVPATRPARPQTAEPAIPDGPKVVSIDSFRKK